MNDMKNEKGTMTGKAVGALQVGSGYEIPAPSPTFPSPASPPKFEAISPVALRQPGAPTACLSCGMLCNSICL